MKLRTALNSSLLMSMVNLSPPQRMNLSKPSFEREENHKAAILPWRRSMFLALMIRVEWGNVGLRGKVGLLRF